MKTLSMLLSPSRKQAYGYKDATKTTVSTANFSVIHPGYSLYNSGDKLTF